MNRTVVARIVALLLALLLTLGVVMPALAAENGGVTIKLHYDRTDSVNSLKWNDLNNAAYQDV